MNAQANFLMESDTALERGFGRMALLLKVIVHSAVKLIKSISFETIIYISAWLCFDQRDCSHSMCLFF